MNKETGSEICMYMAQDYILSSHTFRRAKQHKERKRELNTPRHSLALLRAFLKVSSVARMTWWCCVRGSYFTSEKPPLALADCPGQFRLGVSLQIRHILHNLQDLPCHWHWQSLQPNHSQARKMNFIRASLEERKVGNDAKNALGGA